MGNLEKCPKWVLSPSFFSGNMSKMIPGFLLKKLVPPMMDTGGGAGKVPLAHGLYHFLLDPQIVSDISEILTV